VILEGHSRPAARARRVRYVREMGAERVGGILESAPAQLYWLTQVTVEWWRFEPRRLWLVLPRAAAKIRPAVALSQQFGL